MRYKRLSCAILFFAFLLSLLPLAGSAAEEDNLSLGKSYTVEYDSKIENAFPARAYKQEKALTDGKRASSASYNDSAFLKLYRGTKVSVTIDLEKVSSVSSVEVRSLHNKGAGIDCPRYVHVAVSEDGSSFGTVGSLYDETSVTLSNAQIITHRVALDQQYKARFVRVTFSCDVYVYCDEVTVYGSGDLSDSVSASPDSAADDAGFAAPIDGINNIVLMYTAANYSKATLRPYVAYVDSSGNISDLMFDSMLFLPSGASGYDFGTKKGWDDYTENMFGTGKMINLEALNALVGDLHDQLDLEEGYRYPVFLSVPYLAPGNTVIDGIIPSNLANRLQFLKKYVDRLISTFAGSGFEYLEFKGVYWHHEIVPYTSSTYEDDLMKQFNDYVHSKSLKSIWIPYYCAPGFETANELGFDCATLQSGYAFPRTGSAVTEIGDILPGSVDDSAAQAKKYGLGMEFEFSINASNAAGRFYKYLHTGYASGCMDHGTMMLYQGLTDIYQCANSTSTSENRRVYDLLYQYINKQFTSAAPSVEMEDRLHVIKTGTRARGNLPVVDPDSINSDLKIVDSVATEGLSYSLEGNGFYLVNTKKTTPGKYSVSFCITDGYNTSQRYSLDFLIIDEKLPEVTHTFNTDCTIYSRDDASSSSVVLPAGTVAQCIDIGEGWYYVSAQIDDQEIVGFAQQLNLPPASDGEDSGDSTSTPSAESTASTSLAESQDNSPQDTSPISVTLIVIIAAVALVVVLAVVVLLRKKKH